MGRRAPIRRALVFGGLVVSVVCTYLAVRDLDVEVFIQALRGSDVLWLLPSLVVLAVAVLLRALRWRMLFVSRRRPDFGAVTRALLIGLLFNNILPARAGEVARVVALNRECDVSPMEGLATVVSERVLDLLSLIGLLLVLALFLPDEGWIEGAGLFGVGLAAVLLAACALLLRLTGPLVALGQRLFPRLSPGTVPGAARRLREGLAVFSRPGLALRAYALTMLSWLVLALSAWLASLAFDLGLGVLAVLLVVVAMNFAVAIPSSPGSLGVFEAATQFALGVFEVDESRALSYAVVLHALNFFPYLMIGWPALYWHRTLIRRRTGGDSGASPAATEVAA